MIRGDANKLLLLLVVVVVAVIVSVVVVVVVVLRSGVQGSECSFRGLPICEAAIYHSNRLPPSSGSKTVV